MEDLKKTFGQLRAGRFRPILAGKDGNLIARFPTIGKPNNMVIKIGGPIKQSHIQ